MNKTFSEGNDVITSYRNSKNYGDNWISAGYALWFLRESRYLNNARDLIGTSCMVSGTGFLFSRKIAENINDWPFHTLTEDIEFSADLIVNGYRIAFCPAAEFYDEQPTGFAQSWRQRLRWSKGYLQIFKKYGKRMIKGCMKGNFSCFDMTMSIMPAFILSAMSVTLNLVIGMRGAYARRRYNDSAQIYRRDARKHVSYAFRCRNNHNRQRMETDYPFRIRVRYAA